MPLPPLLLERLKKRKIIVDNPVEDDTAKESKDVPTSVESMYEDRASNQALDIEEEQEEIIAEDYDDELDDNENDNNDTSTTSYPTNDPQGNERTCDSDTGAADNDKKLDIIEGGARDAEEDNVQTTLSYSSILGCPHKYNIFHDCSQYCIDTHSKIDNPQPTLEQRKQLALILRTYPMSNEWSVVYDPGVKTFYFWNIINNLVSWLPPAMKGFVSLPADQIRKTMKELEQEHEL